jgi:hypothetical protein
VKTYDYYRVDLEVAMRTSDTVFGFINVSHIPYNELARIFRTQMLALRHAFLFQDSVGYRIDEELYQSNKAYFDQEIPFKFDFSLFEYTISFSGCYKEEYKQNYKQELPPNWGQLTQPV